jgi:cytochrome o ubiquinol oxidase operon protein cyoD
MHEHLSKMGVPTGTDYGSLKSYLIGFVLSLFLTFCSYFTVVSGVLSKWVLIGLISFFAICQAAVQLVLFLHLSSESKPRWNLMVFLFMALIVGIIVFGSLWIMYNLDYRMM